MITHLDAVPQAIHLCPRCYEPVESGGSLYCASCDAALVFARYMEKAFNATLPAKSPPPPDRWWDPLVAAAMLSGLVLFWCLTIYGSEQLLRRLW